MIFQHTWQQVLDGSKTQTRRLAGDNDEEVRPFEYSPSWPDIFCVLRFSLKCYVKGKRGRELYRVGKTYAIQPGRGKPSVGRVKLLAIRRERLQEITEDEAKQEGVSKGRNDKYLPGSCDYAVWAYRELWDSIHTRKGEQWQDNPEVWVLTFELCKDGEK